MNYDSTSRKKRIMIITMNDKKYDISLRLAAEIEEFGSRVAELESLKSEKKPYYLDFRESSMGNVLNDYTLDLTPNTAHKLSEAISALVEYVTTEDDKFYDVPFIDNAYKARESYQGEPK